jgi:hypothetical protein
MLRSGDLSLIKDRLEEIFMKNMGVIGNVHVHELLNVHVLGENTGSASGYNHGDLFGFDFNECACGWIVNMYDMGDEMGEGYTIGETRRGRTCVILDLLSAALGFPLPYIRLEHIIRAMA